MTENEVSSMFLERYSGNNFDKAVIRSLEEMILTLLKEQTEQTGSDETLPYIFRIIAQGKSRIYLFMDMFASGRVNQLILTNYIPHFDYIRIAMLNVVNYVHNNYETLQPWFKEKFSREGLRETALEMAEAIEKQVGIPRSINFNELNHNEGFFNTALAGILGGERFQNYTEEYIKCLKVFRVYQAACYSLETMPADTKGS